jgi:tetratricopeptide (TPR) repeat protein
MSARLPSRWPSAAALLAAGVLTSAAFAQSSDPLAKPPARPIPRTVPAPMIDPILPARSYILPQLIEEEQVSEHADGPHVAPPIMPAPSRVFQGRGLPQCDRDDGKMSPEELRFRCLLFTLNPLAAFLPLPHLEVEMQTLPAPTYLEHPPQYLPPTPTVPPAAQEVERLEVMPIEIEQLDVMPSEESEPQYQLLAPWTDYTQWFKLPKFPLAEVQVGVKEEETGPVLFGIGAELNTFGTITLTTAPLSEVQPAPAPKVESAACVSPAKVPQVQVNLLVAEVAAKAARKLNLDRSPNGKAPRWVIEVADAARQKALETGLAGLREKGDAKVLAEPRLVTLSGQQASFLSGGQMAIPDPGRAGQSAIRFEEFGTRVTCQPVVLAGGTVRLDVEPEISELCETSGGCKQGVLVPGRSSQRVHTTADVPAGHTLIIAGPKAGGDTRFVLFVTPSVVETPKETGAASAPAPLPVADCEGGDPVHDLLMKCRRELSRGHYAAAEDLAQRAIERDRKQVAADPLVRGSDLLQRVKAIAVLPLGTVEPCAAKGGGGLVPAGAVKAIGSNGRIVEALLEEFNTAYREARYHDAAVLAQSACDLDPQNALATAALQLTRTQNDVMGFRTNVATPAPTVPVVSLRVDGDNTTGDAASAAALAHFQNDIKAGRYEEAKADALRALAVAPSNPFAVAAFQQACEALSRRPSPQTDPQCTYVGTSLRPSLPNVDPAVVGALQKILIEREKAGPFGGSEEAEPKDAGSKPAPRR